MAWLFVFVAGMCEIVWIIAMKLSDGFTRFWPTTIMVISIFASVVFLSLALKQIPIGNAYAVWTGMGAAGVALVGIVWFHEPATLFRLLCIGAIISGTVGLKLLDVQQTSV